jgi:uncharacterized protein (UPF0335 family)
MTGGPEARKSESAARAERRLNVAKKAGTTRALQRKDDRVSETAEQDTEVGGIAADRLRSIVERIERLEEERKALAGDIKDIYAEAKSAGFDVKVIRQIISIRKKEPAEVEEQETLLDLYRRALGM